MRGDDGPSHLPRSYYDRFWQEAYDRELGWDQTSRFAPFGRARPAPGAFSTAWVGAFGDSYTECKGPEEETWEAHLSAILGTRVVNYGVSGFGPDQALLKFQRTAPLHPMRVAFLGYMAENVARLVNRYRFAYDAWALGSVFDLEGRPHWAPTKPRFVLRDGKLGLLPNPVQSRADLDRLLSDRQFQDMVARDDYFRTGYRADSLSPTVGFPFCLRLPLTALHILRRQPASDPVPGLLNDTTTRSLLLAILDEFVAQARSRGVLPVVLLFGTQQDLEEQLSSGRSRRLGAVSAHLERQGTPFVDTVAALAQHARSRTNALSAGAYYDTTSHHSLYAHRVLAEAIAAQLSRWPVGLPDTRRKVPAS